MARLSHDLGKGDFMKRFIQRIQQRYFNFLVIFLGLAQMAACSQSRNSLFEGQRKEELWQPYSLCGVDLPSEFGSTRMGCFSVQLSITRNLAYFDVQELGFNSASVPYRILGRRTGESQYHILADKVTVGAGGAVEVPAKNGHYIEEYEVFHIELSVGKDLSGLNLVQSAAGQGIIVVNGVMNYPELAEVGY